MAGIDCPEISLCDMRLKAKELHATGHPIDAISLQLSLIKLAEKSGKIQAGDYHCLALRFFTVGDYSNAVNAFKMVKKIEPDFPAASLNLGLSLIRVNRLDEAMIQLKLAAPNHPEDLNLLSGLADLYSKIGNIEKSRQYGEKVLDIKDSIAFSMKNDRTLLNRLAPTFRADHPNENIISFSLFGNHKRYLVGAVKNVITAATLYPGWRCRFYCDALVPKITRAALRKAGADVRIMPKPQRPADSLFWRFLVAEDPSVVRFLIRDCDSVLNIREQLAVDEWINSSKVFHVMRDNGSHTDLILAGMWGGVACFLPSLSTLLKDFSYNPATQNRTADQLYLGRVVWPLIKDCCLIHDSVYRNFGARDFPPGSELRQGRHVGDNDYAFR